MTGAAFPPQFPAPPFAQKPPSYPLGLLLNIFWPGSGFTYLGRWSWHLSWMLGLGVLSLVTAIVAGRSLTLIWLLLPVLAYLGMLVHYHVVYGQERARFNPAAPPALSDVIKVLLIVGHFFLNIMGTGILAAVLIPNLLGAQKRAYDSVAMSCAKSLQTMEAVYQVDNQTYATLDQLSGDSAYALCSGKNLVITPLKTPTADDFVFSVYNKAGRTKYIIRPGGLESVVRGNSFSGE